jgi:uncharacterized protein YkwD
VRLVPCARRLLLAAVAAVLVVFAVPAAAHAGCRGADTQISGGSVKQARSAVLCLHNRIRRAHHLPRLHGDARLRRAATRHSHSMIRQRFFDHVAPGGSTLTTRVRTAGYLRRVLGYSLGENIGWGERGLSTPRAMVRAWMNSPGHRRNMLNGSFRDIGIGIAQGTPAGTPGGTYTTDFGKRR